MKALVWCYALVRYRRAIWFGARSGWNRSGLQARGWVQALAPDGTVWLNEARVAEIYEATGILERVRTSPPLYVERPRPRHSHRAQRDHRESEAVTSARTPASARPTLASHRPHRTTGGTTR